jgi:hypothetical protein
VQTAEIWSALIPIPESYVSHTVQTGDSVQVIPKFKVAWRNLQLGCSTKFRVVDEENRESIKSVRAFEDFDGRVLSVVSDQDDPNNVQVFEAPTFLEVMDKMILAYDNKVGWKPTEIHEITLAR